MFKTLPDGVEIYFSWPRGTGRIVPDKSVKLGIQLRDNFVTGLVGLMMLIGAVLGKPPPILGVAMGLLAVAGFVERGRYLSKLPKRSLQLKSEDVDEAYIADQNIFFGIFLTAYGIAGTAGLSYVFFKEVRAGFSFMLVVCGGFALCALVFTYVGFRIVMGKIAKRSSKRRKRRR